MARKLISTIFKGQSFLGVNIFWGSTFSEGQRFLVSTFLGANIFGGQRFIGVPKIEGSTNLGGQ